MGRGEEQGGKGTMMALLGISSVPIFLTAASTGTAPYRHVAKSFADVVDAGQAEALLAHRARGGLGKRPARLQHPARLHALAGHDRSALRRAVELFGSGRLNAVVGHREDIRALKKRHASGPVCAAAYE